MKKISSEKHLNDMDSSRGSFSSRIGYVLAVAGSAVGLGNIWRFQPCCKYGGGMFLLCISNSYSYFWICTNYFRNCIRTYDR